MALNYSKALGISSGIQRVPDQAGWGVNDLKIGNVAELPPEVKKKAEKIKVGVLRNQFFQGLEGLKMGQNLFPGVTTKLSRQLGITEKEVQNNAAQIQSILFKPK